MNTSNIIGRNFEKRILEKCYNEKNAQLVIVSGRIGVGKTFLINELFKDEFVFKFTGSRDIKMSAQLDNFSRELKNRTNKKYSPKNWSEAFFLLRNYLDSLDNNKKSIVFFDEMPWMDSRKSNFLPSFEYFWNDYGSCKENLLFIVCGSAASWLQDKILKNKGGLFNRHSAFITLKPFSLSETELFLNSKNIFWSRDDIVRLYMILGGIPLYLKLLDSNLSLNENIDRLFFSENPLLNNEFNILYSTLFEKEETYIKIISALCESPYGLSRKDISKITKLPYNGFLTNMLSSLEVSGFVETYSRNGDRKERCYRIYDFFSLFYYKFVLNSYYNDHRFWSNSFLTQTRLSYEALGFELVCSNLTDTIKDALYIRGILSKNYPWLKKGTSDTSGAQIDIVIERKDHVTSICEIKFYNNEYIIDKEYAKKLRNKIDVFIKSTNTKNSIQLVLITTYGLQKNMYSNMINKVITIDDLF